MHKVKSIRELLGLTQLELAQGLGCTQGNVAHYERGQTLPPHVAARLISFARRQGVRLTFDHIYGEAQLPGTTRSPAAQSGEQEQVS